MKSLILFLLTLVVTISHAQIPANLITNKADLSIQLLDQINEYRNKNGLTSLILDSNLTKACIHHCEYLSVYDEGAHIETNRDSSHLIENLVSPESRIKRFNADVGNRVAENCLNIGPMVFKEAKHQISGDQWIQNIKAGKIDPSLSALCVLNYWIESPGHNSTLLKKEATVCGVYQKVYVNRHGKYRIVSTLLITNRTY
jgi:uncharacterized protein YkwD